MKGFRLALALVAGAAVVLPGAVMPRPAYAITTIVYDPSAVAQMVQQVAQLKAQLQTLTNTYTKVTQQLEQAQSAYKAVTGTRNLGDVFNNPMLRKYLPADMKKVYDASRAGGYQGITGSIDAILSSEALTGSVAQQQDAIKKRRRNSAAAAQLAAQDAYAGVEARLNQIDQLASKINETTDPKAIADLQARIAIEQSRIATEAQKLQLMSYMAAAQDKLAREQEREVHRKIWASTNSGMPSIKK